MPVASNSTFLADDEKIIRLDPIAPSQVSILSIHLVPGRNLYQVCPSSGLRTGDQFTVQIAEEVTDGGPYNSYPRWTACVKVK